MPGRARVIFDPATGVITEGDVAVNPNASVQFSTDGTPGTYDLESTFTHEIGHLLGLEHSGDLGATMQPRQSLNGLFDLPALTMRTLSDDDRAGIRAIYGPRQGLGAIAGTVNYPGGNSAFGAHVWAEDAATGRIAAGNIALLDGRYRIDGLPPASYRVVVEFLNEPVAASEIASRNGAYAGLSTTTAVSFQTTEVAGQISVAADATTPLNITVGGQPFINPTLVGLSRLDGSNGQLSTISAPVVPGQIFRILVGGQNLMRTQIAPTGISITSPLIRVDANTVDYMEFLDPRTGPVPVISFNVAVDSITPPGDYSIRLQSTTGEVSYVAGGVTVDLPGGVTSPNPIDDTRFFVAQHYRDFLNREPDADGLSFWTNQIESCGTDARCREIRRINVSAAFFLSGEFQETGYLVYRFYRATFNRFPRFNEFLPDTQRVSRGVVFGQPGADAQLEANKQSFANDFVTRAAFIAQFPLTLSPEQFVDNLNANTGSSLTQAERNALVNGLRNGTETRATVLRKVAEDDDFARREANAAFVLIQYFGYLRRNPDDPPDNDFSGFNFWLAKLNRFGGNFVDAELVKAFINSAEYRRRFGTT